MKRQIVVLAIILLLSLMLSSCGSIISGVIKANNKNAVENTKDNSGKGINNSQNDYKNKAEYSVGNAVVSFWDYSESTKYIKVIVPVKNTGETDLFLNSATIDLEGPDGAIVSVLEYVSAEPQIIKPGETAYYYTLQTYDKTVTEGLKAVPHVNVEKSLAKCIRFNVTDIQIVEEEDRFWGNRAKVLGRVENNTDKDYTSWVYIVVNLFDSNGAFLGRILSSTDLKAGEKKGFEEAELYFDVHAFDVASYEAYAYPYQLWNS